MLLVDLQEEHRRDQRFLAAGYDQALANAARLLEAARRGNVPVFHAAYIRDFTVEPPRPFEVVGSRGEPGFSDAAAADFVAICPEVAPQPGEAVIVKQDASAFKGTTLDADLKGRGSAWLAIAGAWTEACVAATVRDAVARGYRVLLVKDACASGTALMHQIGILNLANRLLGGAVANAAAASAILAGQPARVWRFTAMVPFRYTAETADQLYEAL